MAKEPAAAAEEARIRAVIDDWTDALRRKHAAGVVAHHGHGFVLFSLAPPLVSDAADAEGLDAWFATWDGPLELEHRGLQVTAGGDTAFVHGLTRLAGTKVGGRRDEIWFRQTLGFRLEGGSWRIVHQHESVPFYMDGSDRASVDLRP